MRYTPLIASTTTLLTLTASGALYLTRQQCAFLPAIIAAGSFSVLLYDRLQAKITKCLRPSADAYEDGWEAGYDKGWRDAKEPPKLTVIHRTD